MVKRDFDNEPLTPAEQVILQLLSESPWMTDREVRLGLEADGLDWLPAMPRALARAGALEMISPAEVMNVSRAWALTERGRQLLDLLSMQDDSLAAGSVDLSPLAAGEDWPGIPVYVWLEEAESWWIWASLEDPVTELAHCLVVPLPTNANALSAWYYRARKAVRLAGGGVPGAGQRNSWPTLPLWTWLDNETEQVHVSAVRTMGSSRVDLDLPSEVAWAASMMNDIKSVASRATGLPPTTGAIRDLVHWESDRRRRQQNTAAEADRAAASSRYRPQDYPIAAKVSVRTISAGAPGLGRRR